MFVVHSSPSPGQTLDGVPKCHVETDVGMALGGVIGGVVSAE